MSGSGGGHNSYNANRYSNSLNRFSNGQGAGGGNNICQSLDELTYINSPKSGVNNLSKGDVLELKVEGSSVRIIKLYDKNGYLIGGVSPIKVDQIINCIEDGYEYVAEVLDVNMAQVQIRITCKT